MLGVAALAAALVSAFGRPAAVPLLASPLTALTAQHAVVVLPQEPRRTRSCSAQRSHAGAVERRVLPVACEQPPRSRVGVPNGATGALSSLLGG